MTFEWDETKERINIQKHGLDFKQAAHVWDDPWRIEFWDETHSLEELRFITIGIINDQLTVVTVAYTERFETIRIISARRATKSEKEAYYSDGIL